MRSIPVLSTILALWIIGGMFLQNYFCCGPKAATAAAATSGMSGLYIADGETAIAAASNDDLLFGISKDDAIVSEAVKEEFLKVTKHLAASPDKRLALTGLYRSNETNSTAFDNLGLARATDLKNYFIEEFEIPGDLITTSSSLDNDLSGNKKHVFGGMLYEFISSSLSPSSSLSITDGDGFEAVSKDQLVFKKSSFNYEVPLSKELIDVLEKTTLYLKENPNRVLTITGFYTDDEENSSILPNLGLARANVIKSFFTQRDVSSSQFVIESEEVDSSNIIDDILSGGVSLIIGTADATTSSEPIDNSVTEDKLMIYFESNAKRLNLNPDQRNFFSRAISYLDQNSAAKIVLVGHTDNQGPNRKSNIRLGRKRAEFVRDYLIENGISKKQIKWESKGPDDPLASNSSSEGRAKNRRVEVSIMG